jgi:hypothetical protein
LKVGSAATASPPRWRSASSHGEPFVTARGRQSGGPDQSAWGSEAGKDSSSCSSR